MHISTHCGIEKQFYGLLHVVKNHSLVKFTYQKFWDDKTSERKLEAYALKEFKNRWYILGKDLVDNEIKTFGLDRLKDLEITAKKFIYPKDYNIEKQFLNCFGIISPNGNQLEKIVLSFNSFQGKYIKTMPLHQTQKIQLDNEKELIIELNLYITHDFIMDLLSFGENVKVLEPQSLIIEIKQRHINALNMY